MDMDENRNNDYFHTLLLDFGTQVKAFREKKEMSQRDLSVISGVSSGYVAPIELGKASPSKEIISKIASALHMENDPTYLKLIYFKLNTVSLRSNYPHISEVFKLTISSMNEDERALTFNRCERRLGEFSEDRYLLARNLALFFMGKLKISEEPENGLRPLYHYIADWNDSIDKWNSIAREDRQI